VVCDLSKNDTELQEVHKHIEDQILAVLPLTRHLAPFYDALVCSRAYSHDIQERTVQSLNAIAQVGGNLMGLLALHVLTIIHAATANVPLRFLLWLEECSTETKLGATSSTVEDQTEDVYKCVLFDSVKTAIELHFLTDDLWQPLQLLLDGIIEQIAHMITIEYYAEQTDDMDTIQYSCLSAILRKLGKFFAKYKSPLRQALWQLIVDADNAVYSQWHLRYMLTNLWYANASTLAAGFNELYRSALKGWIQLTIHNVLTGHTADDTEELRPGCELRMQLLSLIDYFSDYDDDDVTESDSHSVLERDTSDTSSSIDCTAEDTALEIVLPDDVENSLVDVIIILQDAYSKFIENGRAIKLLLQPLGQALARGVLNLKLSIELQDMVASLDTSANTEVKVNEADDIAVEHSDAEKMFADLVTSVINFCKQYVLKRRRT
jgi:hypothetical protein